MSKWINFKNSAGSKPAELMIYGDIGDWWEELDAKSIADKIKAADGDALNVRINSGGGSVFTAQAVYSILRASGKKISVYIDGLAASAATIIACAGDAVYMPENTLYMVHNPLVMSYGNAEEMRETADLLDKVRDTIVAAYRNKTNLEDSKIIELMDAETWMTAQEAREFGFVDEVLEPFAVAATLQKDKIVVNSVEMSAERLKNIPKSFTNQVQSSKSSEVKNMDLETLKAQHPDVFNAAIATVDVNAAVKAERERIADINAACMVGNEALASEHIENGSDAGVFALAQAKAEKAKAQTFLADRKQDAEPANNVPVTEPPQDDKLSDAEAILAANNKRKGVK